MVKQMGSAGAIPHDTLCNLNPGDKFTWQNEVYELIDHVVDSNGGFLGNSKVKDKLGNETNFNSYAHVMPYVDTDAVAERSSN